jgi:Nuclease-related domain
MPFKARAISNELKVLRLLNTRLDLSADQQQHYSNLEKGFAGEVQFDLLTEKLQSDCLILNDLLFEVNKMECQIDTTVIFQETIYFFEVKNYEGDFCYDAEGFHAISGKEYKDPLDQIKRSKSLLRQLLQNLGYDFPIEAYVVFINPEFTLYQSPKDLPIIFPTQLNRFLKKLNTKKSKLTNKHTKLAEQLVSLHLPESSYTQLPTYKYDQLKKGITCKVCNSFLMSIRGQKIVCHECGCQELVDSAVMRSVVEFTLLLPNHRITTNVIHEWCKVVESKKRISRILGRNFKIKGFGQWSYYE